MSVIWSITYGATTQSLAAWGIDRATLSRYNLDTESLSLSQPLDDFTAEPAFDLGAVITLKRDSVIWFIGKVRERPITLEAGRLRQTFVVRNAWHSFKRIIYQQQYTVPNADFSAVLGSWSTQVTLGQDQFGHAITSTAQISLIAGYANAAGGGLITVASLPEWVTPPLEVARDISCAEAIRRMLAYAPDAVGAFSYDTGSQVLTIKQRSALDVVTLDLADADHVEVLDGLTEVPDLLVPGVLLIYKYTEVLEDGNDVLREYREEVGNWRTEGALIATIQLAQGETYPVGIASQYEAAMGEMPWRGSLRYHERDCSGLLRPGVKVNLTSGRTAWATAGAVVQSTTEDLIQGVTTVDLGPPEHLGLTDFADIMRRWRERFHAGTFPVTQHNATEGISEQVDGADPSPTHGEIGDTPVGQDPTAGGAVGGDPDEDPMGRVSNPDRGRPAAIMSQVRIPFCSGTETKIARVVGVVESAPA